MEARRPRDILNELMGAIAKDPMCELLQEHLEAAGASLAEASPLQYAVNLRLASEAADTVSDLLLRQKLVGFIQAELQGLP